MSSFEVGTYNKYYTMDKQPMKKELVTMAIAITLYGFWRVILSSCSV